MHDWFCTAVAVALMSTAACTAPRGHRDASPPTASVQDQRLAPELDHVAPTRDSTGSTPKHFEWTRVEGADHYVIGIFNEAGVLIWKQDHVSTTSVDSPADLELDFGTYWWSVSAIRDESPIADSGRSAFVVLR